MTVADRRYLRDLFGVTREQSAASGHPIYDIQTFGVDAVGIGFSATWRFSGRYLFNIDGAANRLGHEPGDSPLAERPSAHVIAINLDYRW